MKAKDALEQDRRAFLQVAGVATGNLRPSKSVVGSTRRD